MLLADLGADVVKVEPPEGDGTRGWGPPWVGEAADRTAAYFLAVNRNKRSLRLDLKTRGGREVLRRLLARADVLVENHRVGGFARLGFDEATLEALNPRLVHLAISGYGPTGPQANTPGYDFVVQAVSGLMSITGHPAADGGEPTKVGVAISDLTTGMLGATAVLAAIAGRDRPGSPAFGRGQRIDISLLESTLSWLANQAQNLFVTGESPGRLGNAHPNIVPYETFVTADGEIAIAVGSERQWPRFTVAIGAPELTDDSRFETNGARVANREALRPLIAERLAAQPTRAWLARLAEAEVPAGPINDLAAAFASPQVAARGLLTEVEHPVLGPLRQVGPPFELHATPATVRTAPPLLGEQTDEILAELGFSPSEVATLRDDGVI
jgi:crotonobetainyl-CoA:carnitine CoA-transferase CaiB-like acyl-CoA transferase